MEAIDEHAAELGVAPLCSALGVARATYYRRRQPKHSEPRQRKRPPRALSADEQRAVLDTLNSERFADQAPAQVFAQLLDEGAYLCSVRTMYRILDANAQVRERRDVLRHPEYKKPELLATAPNQVWSWDITKLLGPTKWTYFYLYVLLDIFSRYVVGWLLAPRESAELAKQLLAEAYEKQGLQPGALTVHSDRGAPMLSKGVAMLLADLGVTKTHSRPHVSDDNPFSEAQFKTLKYRPDFPERFGCDADARAHCRSFFGWYNSAHHHSALGLLTPEQVHYGLAADIVRHREDVLRAAHTAHPERFPHGRPRATQPPTEVWINQPRVVAPAPSQHASPGSAPHLRDCAPTPPLRHGARHGVVSSQAAHQHPLGLSRTLNDELGAAHHSAAELIILPS